MPKLGVKLGSHFDSLCISTSLLPISEAGGQSRKDGLSWHRLPTTHSYRRLKNYSLQQETRFIPRCGRTYCVSSNLLSCPDPTSQIVFNLKHKKHLPRGLKWIYHETASIMHDPKPQVRTNAYFLLIFHRIFPRERAGEASPASDPPHLH